MAQRWVTEEELQQLSQQFENGGTTQSNPLQQFFEQLPPELQEKIMLLPPEKQQEVLMQLLDRSNNMSQNNQQFAQGGTAEQVPVEAERNETLTTQDGSIPNTEGGYLERKSFNPISGQATYEIPDNEHNQTHPEGGVNMVLKEGDVVNSDKTKIPTDFKVYGKNFKGKTFKEASDFLSKKEEGIQKQLTELQKEGKADRVSENSVSIMLAKASINRNELNELQEQVLESKKQKEHNQLLEGNIKKFGGLIKNATKAEEVYNKTLDRFLNGYTTERPVLKAEKGLSASISKMQSFTDKIAGNPNMSTQDVMAAFKQSGLGNAPTTANKSNFKNSVSYDYKPKNVTIPKQEIFSTITSTANKYGVDPTLMFTMADIESSFNPNATSKTGAAGLFQFTKGTGRQYGIEGEKRYDLKANTDAGARLLLDNQKILIKNGIEPTPVYTYLAHQLGVGGAIELYNNITKGTPISDTTKSNMGLNFGKKSAEQYLAETTKKVMSRYDGYATKLQQKDADLSLDAHTFKNKYSLPGSPKEIKNNLLIDGKEGFIQKLKSGSLDFSSMAGNFKNASTSNYMQGFEQGGEVEKVSNISYESPYQSYSDPHPKALESFKKDYYNSLEGESSIYVDGKYYVYDGANPVKTKTGKINTPLDKEDEEYKKALELLDNEATLDAKNTYFGNIFSKMGEVPSGYKVPDDYKDFLSKLRQESKGNVNYYDDTDAYSRYVNPLDKDPKAEDVNKYINKFGGYKPSSVRDFLFENRNNFKHGGYIADGGFNFTTWQGDKVIKGRNKADYTPEDLQSIASYYFPNKKYTSNKELQQDILDYLGEDYNKYVIPTPVGTKTGLNPTQSLVDDKFGDDWNLAIAKMKEGIIQPLSPLGLQKLNVITNSKYDLPSDIVSNSTLNESKANSYVPLEDEEDEESTTTSTPGQNNQNKEASWLDKLKYGMRESLPYLDNLRLMREGRIMPTLQQRPYDNPYDNMRTDYNIQSNLNENQRALLTTIADSTGNPSVRNARLAQLAANAANMNNQLYSQKYNQELAMENQKTLGQGNYRNQFNLDNMNLQKRYEQEVLQTIENQRQQKHMASNKMMNDYLRKQEQDQARDLALLETNYDWNPYSGKPEFNPEKAERNMAYKKATFSPKGKGSQVIEGKDEQKTKYGGKIKRK